LEWSLCTIASQIPNASACALLEFQPKELPLSSTLSPTSPIPTTLAPWLCVRKSAEAVAFYKSAFDAKEVYRMDAGDGIVARLSIHGR
jgi:hypothetical protein